jgi:biopolymer transport protein TolR
MRPLIRRQGRAAAAVRPEINVTPLVDVCLVLLIIFMVVTPQLRKSVDVALPETARPASLPDLRGLVTVSITRDGSVFVDHAKVPRQRLVETLHALHGQANAAPLVIDGDRLLLYRQVATVLQAARDAGFQRVGLATRKMTLD